MIARQVKILQLIIVIDVNTGRKLWGKAIIKKGLVLVWTTDGSNIRGGKEVVLGVRWLGQMPRCHTEMRLRKEIR